MLFGADELNGGFDSGWKKGLGGIRILGRLDEVGKLLLLCSPIGAEAELIADMTWAWARKLAS